jgi:phenylacetate-CoA ligase
MFRLKERIAHPTLRHIWGQMLSVDEMQRDELRALQDDRTQRLIAEITAHVPFYRRWADGTGYQPGDTVSLADLPIVTKDDYRTAPDAFQSDRFTPASMWVLKTSGSSAEPFQFRQHQSSLDYSYACFWRAMRRRGIHAGERRLYLWGRSHVFGASRKAILQRDVRNIIRDRMANTMSIDAYALSDTNVAAVVPRLRKFAPTFIHGYVSALYVLARHLLETKNEFSLGQVKAVVTESEKLYEFQRATISEAFGCPVVEHYGCCEIGNLAQEDDCGTLRWNDDLYALEVGSQGEAIVTSLVSAAFPFVRYRLGDLVIASQTAASHLPYTSLEKVVGRTLDLVPLTRGGYVHGVALTHAINPHLEHIRKYQIRQRALDDFLVRLVPVAAIPKEVLDRIASDLRGMLGPATQIEFLLEGKIPPDASGKFRWVVVDAK